MGAAEQRFQLVVASVKDYAIFMLDRSGRVATWNAGASVIKGYRPEEIIGKEISVFYTPEDRARRMSSNPRRMVAGPARSQNVVLVKLAEAVVPRTRAALFEARMPPTERVVVVVTPDDAADVWRTTIASPFLAQPESPT